MLSSLIIGFLRIFCSQAKKAVEEVCYAHKIFSVHLALDFGLIGDLVHCCRWNTYVVEGHDVEELCKAFWQAQQVKDKPTCIVARTLKGKGLKSG